MIRAAFACLALLAVVACSSAANVKQPATTYQSPSQSHRTAKPSAVISPPPSYVAPSRLPPNSSQSSAWPVPDQHLTPGAVTTAMVIDGKTVPCALPRPPKERNVPISEKRLVAHEYAYVGPFDAVEFDHRVPFALCGSNGPANIWPEPLATAKLKDRLEDAVIRQVKAHQLTLGQGQAVFLGDWRTAWCRYVHTTGVACG